MHLLVLNVFSHKAVVQRIHAFPMIWSDRVVRIPWMKQQDTASQFDHFESLNTNVNISSNTAWIQGGFLY